MLSACTEGLRGHRCVVAAVLAGLLLLSQARSVPGQVVQLDARLSPDDPRAVKAVIDGLVRERMTAGSIPGAAVAVVSNGRVVMLAGYGTANRASGAPVDPELTRFRLGSVSKLITATAVMQLVEEGRIDLAADVNTYTGDVHVPAAFNRPVRVADLLTHTAGFEDRLAGTASRTPGGVKALGDYLRTDLPARVRPPGDLISYSNHGYTLLGLVVERVSGMPFHEFARRRIFEPLGMARSTFVPYGPEAGDLAIGYEPLPSGMAPTTQAFVNIWPAAGLVSTAADMSRFMLAHLEDDPPGGTLVLAPATRALMQRQQFTNDRRLPGLTFGFFESFFFRERNLFHEGGIRGYSSLLCLLPARHLGLFVVNNGYRQGFGFAVVDGFLKRLLASDPPPLPPPQAGAAARARAAAGTYSHVKRAWTTVEALSSKLRRPTIVLANEDGSVSVYGEVYGEIAPFVYRRSGGFERLAFRVGAGGSVNAMFLDQEAYDRLAWHQTPSSQQTLLALFVAVFVSILIRRPEQTRLGLDAPDEVTPDDPGPARLLRISRQVSALNVVFVVGLFVIFATTGPGVIWFGVPWRVVPVLTIPLITLPLSAVFAVMAVRSWRQGWLGVGRRLHVSLGAVAAVTFPLLLHAWNLLGYRF